MILKPIMREGPFGGLLPDKIRILVRALTEGGEQPGTVTELDDETVAMAVSEGLGPLLGARVAARRIAVPEQRRGALLWQHQACTGDNLLRDRTVEDLASLYERRAIPLLLLKGMALFQSTFARGERSMVDIDVLVPPSRWKEACALVTTAGFEPDHRPGRSYTADHDYVRSFTNPGRVVVEIHLQRTRHVATRSLFRAIDAVQSLRSGERR